MQFGPQVLPSLWHDRLETQFLQRRMRGSIFAPKGTPKPVADKLSDALNKALDDPAVAKRLLDLGGTVPPKADRGPAYLAKLSTADIARWDPILKAAAAKMN
jgi:putative tricarboxylic transport membrane protein